MKIADNIQNPWAGPSSYEDPANSERKLKFCGRDSETYDVTHLIDDNFFITLYGKSGIGKTSLLNAGVFPALRREQYTPINIRLGIKDENVLHSYQSMIIDTIKTTIKCIKPINVLEEQKDQQAIDFLWNYFARHQFMNTEGKTTFPVIVFDQFEEVYRTPQTRQKAEVLLAQLHYLIDEGHALNDCIVDGKEYSYDFNFRFVLSIREDDLYHLEDSIDNCSLLALKRCRYRLRDLSEEGARDVILIPGKELFRKEDVDGIVETLISKSRNEDGCISTILISLLCSRIFIDSLHRDNIGNISQQMVENFIKKNPLEQFYNEATLGLSYKEKLYIEDNFIDSTGRRNSIPESNLLLKIKNGKKLLEDGNRILQYTGTSSNGGNRRVELIHDSFCEAILNIRRNRQNKRRRFFYALLLLLAFFFVGEIIDMISRKEKEPPTTWYFNLQETDNFDGYSWGAKIYIMKKGKNGDTCVIDSDSIFSNDWDYKKISYTPDSTINEFIVRVHFIKGKEKFFEIPDTTINVNSNVKSHLIVKEVREKGYKYEFLTQTTYNKSDVLPVQNATIILKEKVGYTDAEGKCRMILPHEMSAGDTIIIFREGYHSILQIWNKSTPAIFTMKQQQEYSNMAEKERDARMNRLDLLETPNSKKKANYTQTLTLRRNNNTIDTIYLCAYVDTVYVQKINGQDRQLESVKGCYYYHSDYPHPREMATWRKIPNGKIYLLDGYVDESSRTDEKNYCTYFFEGTDIANNKQQLLGGANGNSPWKNGHLIIPGDKDNSGVYESEKKAKINIQRKK